MKRYSWAVIYLLFCGSMLAQSQKTVREKGISMREVTEINYEEGLKKAVIQEEKFFDTAGNLIEERAYNKDGKIKKWLRFTYTERDQIESESVLDAKGKLTEKVVYVYEDDLRAEKHYYDGKNRLVKKKVYEYGFH